MKTIKLKQLLYLVLILNISGIFSACAKEKIETSKVTNESVNKLGNVSSRSEDIKMVLNHIKKSKENISDENGLPLNYEYTVKTVKSKNLGSTGIISSSGRFKNSLNLNIKVLVNSIDLKLNGKSLKKVNFIVHKYSYYELNPIVSDDIPNKYTSKTYIYYPELDDETQSKEIISTISRTAMSRLLGKLVSKDEISKKLDNDWIIAVSNLIKKSNITKIKSLSDFNTIEDKIEKEFDPIVKETVEKVEYIGYTTGTNILIREGPSTENKKVGILKEKGLEFEIIDVHTPLKGLYTIRYDSSALLESGDWYKLKKGSVIEIISTEEDTNSYKINIKESENNTITALINKNYVSKSSGISWFQIETKEGKTGWVYGKFVEFKS